MHPCRPLAVGRAEPPAVATDGAGRKNSGIAHSYDAPSRPPPKPVGVPAPVIGVSAAGRMGHSEPISTSPMRYPGRFPVRHGSVTDKTARGEALPVDKRLDRIPVSPDNGCDVLR